MARTCRQECLSFTWNEQHLIHSFMLISGFFCFNLVSIDLAMKADTQVRCSFPTLNTWFSLKCANQKISHFGLIEELRRNVLIMSLLAAQRCLLMEQNTTICTHNLLEQLNNRARQQVDELSLRGENQVIGAFCFSPESISVHAERVFVFVASPPQTVHFPHFHRAAVCLPSSSSSSSLSPPQSARLLAQAAAICSAL